jgi:divalent metal cation (Fe/Co/Zn/Cd) transporter
MTNNLKKGQKVTEIAIGIEGLLVISKFVVGFLSGGLALISDAIHSGSDFEE